MSAYVHNLAEYSPWANGRILEFAARAEASDYVASSPGLSFGSLHGTLVHLFEATATWLGRWQAAGDGFGATPEDFAGVRRLAEETDAALVRFVDRCSDADLAAMVSYLGPDGVTYTDPLLMQLTHLLLHGRSSARRPPCASRRWGSHPGTST